MKSRYSCMSVTFLVCCLSASLAQERSKDLLKPSERILNLRNLAFSADGRLMAGCCGEPTDKGEVVVWDTKTHKVLWFYKIDKGMPSIAFSPDGKVLAVGTFMENCYLFVAETGKLQATLPGHGESARSVAFAPDGRTLAVGSYDETIRLWDWRAGKVLQQLEGQLDKVYRLAYLPNGKILASGGSHGTACLWDMAKSDLLKRWDHDSSPIAFDPQGLWLATAGNDASVSIRSLEDYDKVLARYEGVFAYQLLLIHPTSKAFVAHSGMNTLIRVFPLDLQQATPADEKRAQELIAVWDEESYEVREKASRDLAKMGYVAKPLLSKIVKDSPSAEVRVRARELLRVLDNPKALAELRGHDEYVRCASFSPDGQILATGDQSGLILLWNTATYKQIATIHWPKD
jgi:WD40 repeat protein